VLGAAWPTEPLPPPGSEGVALSYLAYLLGFLAAMCNGLANVAQRAANRQVPSEHQLSLRLLLKLVRRPVWLAGIAAVMVSFVLQATGLGLGTLAAIEPLLVLELPLTLIGARFLLGERLGPRAWWSIAAMTGGTIALIAFLGPSGGQPVGISWWVWTVAIVATFSVVAALYLGAQRTDSRARRSALLGAATGTAFGLAASLTKGMTEQFSNGGMAGIFTSWQLYMAFATGFFAMWMLQNALNAGRLVVAQPGITLADPYVSIIWGAVVFGETMRGGYFILLAILAGAVMTGATFILAHSPAWQAVEPGTSSKDQRPKDGPGDQGRAGEGTGWVGARSQI
jgi:drug/metabolite transporter (DMT)-like permease